jgi:hypothetical protein
VVALVEEAVASIVYVSGRDFCCFFRPSGEKTHAGIHGMKPCATSRHCSAGKRRIELEPTPARPAEKRLIINQSIIISGGKGLSKSIGSVVQRIERSHQRIPESTLKSTSHMIIIPVFLFD